jgi:hypothetical protein
MTQRHPACLIPYRELLWYTPSYAMNRVAEESL